MAQSASSIRRPGLHPPRNARAAGGSLCTTTAVAFHEAEGPAAALFSSKVTASCHLGLKKASRRRNLDAATTFCWCEACRDLSLPRRTACARCALIGASGAVLGRPHRGFHHRRYGARPGGGRAGQEHRADLGGNVPAADHPGRPSRRNAGQRRALPCQRGERLRAGGTGGGLARFREHAPESSWWRASLLSDGPERLGEAIPQLQLAHCDLTPGGPSEAYLPGTPGPGITNFGWYAAPQIPRLYVIQVRMRR